MPSCIFNTCCGCCELRTGCLVIGYLNLVYEIILIIAGLLLMLGSGVALSEHDNQKSQEIGTVMLIVSVVLLLFTILFLAFTIVLLVGLHKNKRGHIKAYLIFSVIFLVIYIISFFASFASDTIIVWEVIKEIVTILLGVYFLLVIRSYYHKMDDKRPAIYSSA